MVNIPATPKGTGGVATLVQGEPVGVAANWFDEDGIVYHLAGNKWQPTQWRVADFLCNPYKALRYEVMGIVLDGGDDDDVFDTVEDAMVRAFNC